MEMPNQATAAVLDAASPSRQYRLVSGPSAYAPVTPWSPWGGTAAAIGCFLGAVVAIFVSLVVIAYVTNGPAPASVDELLSRINQSLESVYLQILVTLIQQVAMIILTLWAAGRYGGRVVEVLALRPPAPGWKSYVIALLAFLAAVVAMTVIIRLGGIPVDKNDIKMFEGMFKSQWWWLAVILVGVGAPLSEELLCRGFLFSALAKSRIGIWGASIITSLIFAVVHPYSIVSVIQVFAIGMLFSWMLVRTGSLRVPIICHSIFNTLQALALLHGVTPP